MTGNSIGTAREGHVSAARQVVNWQRVTSDRHDLGHHFLDVMSEMDSHYAACDPSEQIQLMTTGGWEYYVGTGEGFELVVGYQWDGGHNKFQVRSTGFRGCLEPHEALALVADHVLEFIRTHDQSAVYAILPSAMDNPRMMQAIGLIPWYAGWRATGGHHVAGGAFWKIEPL